MKEREHGYYWCRIGERWIIARWWSAYADCRDPEWDVSGRIESDSHFDEIDERRIERESECDHDYRTNQDYSVCVKCFNRIPNEEDDGD